MSSHIAQPRECSSAAMQRCRAEAITWVRIQIARFGLTYTDLVAAGVFPSPKRMNRVRYRNANGQTWSGEGKMPGWLKRAIWAGQCLEHFRVRRS